MYIKQTNQLFCTALRDISYPKKNISNLPGKAMRLNVETTLIYKIRSNLPLN